MHFIVFFRVSSDFSSITSEQAVGSILKIDNFGLRKIAHLMMYDSSIFIDFPGSSLRTNKQTNRQTDRHPYSINIYRLGLRPSPVALRAARIGLRPTIFYNSSNLLDRLPAFSRKTSFLEYWPTLTSIFAVKKWR